MSHPAPDHGRENVPEPVTPQPRLQPPTGPNSPPKGWGHAVPSHHLQHPGAVSNMPPQPLSYEQELHIRRILQELEFLHANVRQSDAALQHFKANLPPTLKNLWQLEPRQYKGAMTPPHRPVQDVSRTAAPQGGNTWDPVSGGTTQAPINRYDGYHGPLHPSGYGPPPAAHVAMGTLPTGEPGKRRRE